ncbi:hypothetical protein S40288_11774, partial [Stachybotrys chartarum IBT 40288]
MASSRTDRR